MYLRTWSSFAGRVSDYYASLSSRARLVRATSSERNFAKETEKEWKKTEDTRSQRAQKEADFWKEANDSRSKSGNLWLASFMRLLVDYRLTLTSSFVFQWDVCERHDPPLRNRQTDEPISQGIGLPTYGERVLQSISSVHFRSPCRQSRLLPDWTTDLSLPWRREQIY